MKIMNKFAVIIAALAMCMATVSTSVSGKVCSLSDEVDYNENLTEEIVTEEEIPVEETIPDEEEAEPADETPEETVPEEVVPEEAPQDAPEAPAQEETPDEDSESEVDWDHLTPKEPLTLVQDDFYTVILDPVEHAYCRFSEEETVEGLIKVGRLTVVPDGVCRVTRLYATDQDGKVIDGLVPKGGTSDPISMSVAGVPSVKYYTFTFHVEVDSMYAISLNDLEAYHIPVSISSERAHAGDKIKVNVEETAGYTPSIGITFGNGKTEWHKNVWSYEFEMPADNVNVEVHLDAELYSIDIQSDEHLKVKAYTEWNEEITTSRAGLNLHLEIDADPPYVVDSITYLDAEGNPIDDLYGWQFSMPATDLTIKVKEKIQITYVDENGDEHVCEGFKDIEKEPDVSLNEWGEIGKTTWYVVSNDRAMEYRPTILGDVNIILSDGVTLTMKSGIQCSNYGDTKLSFWGQEKGTGKLVATASGGQSGIGGDEGEKSCTINFHGGIIQANGGISGGAGIGGGTNASAGTINFYGGIIEASGITGGGAGIGGGINASAGTINIHGGNIEAKGGEEGGAGIGGGIEASGGTINIYGGEVIATGGNYWNGAGAGIGGGNHGDGGNINIFGGDTTATGAKWGAGIGGGNCGNGGNITISGGIVEANGSKGGAGIGGGDDGNGGTITISGGKIYATGKEGGAGIGGGDDGNGGTINISDGCSIDARSEGEQDGLGGAGIGGGDAGNGGNITIYGGSIFSTGNNGGAGIGGGDGCDGGFITIYHGNIYAVGGSCNRDYLIDNKASSGAGIGGGDNADSGTINIYGGNITAHSSLVETSLMHDNHWGAGIGAGDDGDVKYIAINLVYGGTIEAKGYHAVGCGEDGDEEKGKMWISSSSVKTESGSISGHEVVLNSK